MFSNFSSVLAQRPGNSVCVFSLFLSFFCRGGGGGGGALWERHVTHQCNMTQGAVHLTFERGSGVGDFWSARIFSETCWAGYFFPFSMLCRIFFLSYFFAGSVQVFVKIHLHLHCGYCSNKF